MRVDKCQLRLKYLSPPCRVASRALAPALSLPTTKSNAILIGATGRRCQAQQSRAASFLCPFPSCPDLPFQLAISLRSIKSWLRRSTATLGATLASPASLLSVETRKVLWFKCASILLAGRSQKQVRGTAQCQSQSQLWKDFNTCSKIFPRPTKLQLAGTSSTTEAEILPNI